MIVACPHCAARFRVAAEKLTANKLALRCSRCRKVFPLAPPEADPVSESKFDGHVLVAHSDPGLCRTIGELLSRHQIAYDLADDGTSALAAMDRRPPRVVLVDVALPGLYAFEVVDKVRSRPGLEQVKIILLSSVYNKMAYKCRPKSLYGADDYIEKHHLPDSLVPKIRQLSSRDPAAVSAPAPEDPASYPADWHEVNESIRQAETREVTADDQSLALNKARRLARIIVSDIALYNQARVEEGVASGRFHELFAKEIAEGRKVFAERVAADIIAREDFLSDAFAELIDKRQRDLNT